MNLEEAYKQVIGLYRTAHGLPNAAPQSQASESGGTRPAESPAVAALTCDRCERDISGDMYRVRSFGTDGVRLDLCLECWGKEEE